MDFADLDKIKINNAIVTFILLTDCLLFPLAILMATDFKLIFNLEALKLIIACSVFGCCQFAYAYALGALFISLLNERDWENEKLVNLIFRRSLICYEYEDYKKFQESLKEGNTF